MTPDNIDTKALRELEAKATPGPWTRGEYDEAITSPSGGVFDRGTGLIAQQEADEALTCALRNAAPALLDAIEAQRKEIEHRDERIAKLSARVSYYESALCFTPPRPWTLPPDGVVTGNIETERVGDVLAERDALKAEVERLRALVGPLTEAVRDTEHLVGSSRGVAGLHLNGDEAPWDELTGDGCLSGWLGSLTRASAALRGEEASRG